MKLIEKEYPQATITLFPDEILANIASHDLETYKSMLNIPQFVRSIYMKDTKKILMDRYKKVYFFDIEPSDWIMTEEDYMLDSYSYLNVTKTIKEAIQDLLFNLEIRSMNTCLIKSKFYDNIWYFLFDGPIGDYEVPLQTLKEEQLKEEQLKEEQLKEEQLKEEQLDGSFVDINDKKRYYFNKDVRDYMLVGKAVLYSNIIDISKFTDTVLDAPSGVVSHVAYEFLNDQSKLKLSPTYENIKIKSVFLVDESIYQ